MSQSRKSVIDTSWGREIPGHFDDEQAEAARQKYRDAVTKTQKRVSYRELFTVASEAGLKRLQKRIGDRGDRYTARVLKGVSDEWVMIDFMVVDDEFILLSRSQGDTAIFYEIRDRDLSALFSGYFNDCWNDAWNIEEHGQVLTACKGSTREPIDSSWSTMF